MSSTRTGRTSAKPRYQPTERLIRKYEIGDFMDTVGSIFDIAGDFLGIIEDPLSPGSWFDLLNDGWTLGNMQGAQNSAQSALESLQNQIGSMGGTLIDVQDMKNNQNADIDAIEGELNQIMQQQ
jgi:hypothetical protein